MEGESTGQGGVDWPAGSAGTSRTGARRLGLCRRRERACRSPGVLMQSSRGPTTPAGPNPPGNSRPDAAS